MYFQDILLNNHLQTIVRHKVTALRIFTQYAHDVVLTLWTLRGRRNNVVCLLGTCTVLVF